MLWCALAALLLASGALLSAGWHYSNQLLTPGAGALPSERTHVLGGGSGEVLLERTADSVRSGVFGLRFDDGAVRAGYALAGPPSIDQGAVRRAVQPVTGVVADAASVQFDGAYFPEDPVRAFEFPLVEVDIEGPLGTYPAYLDDRGSDTWVVFVHGRGADRREGFRLLSVLHDLELTTLLITYRNDPGAPASPDGRYGLGSTEWRDLQAAVRHALDAGAEQVVLAGASTGGVITATFLHEAPESAAVAGVVLDAPVLDWGPVLHRAAVERGLPRPLTTVAMAVAQARGIPWARLDVVRRADELAHPVLVFHGTQDRTVPLGTSRALAVARPDLVTLVEVPGAGHVQAWNADPHAYGASVAGWLDEVGVAVDAFDGALLPAA